LFISEKITRKKRILFWSRVEMLK